MKRRIPPQSGLAWHHQSLTAALLPLVLALATLWPAPGVAEDLKIGVLKIAAQGPTFIALDRGYFAGEGFTAQPIYFDAGQPVAVATVSGDIDFGMAGVTAGLFSLGMQGQLRIISGYLREVPNFHSTALVVSNQAFESGFKSFKDFPGYSMATSQIGSTFHYQLGLLADKFHFDMATVRVLALQSMPNAVAAMMGGQADSVMAQPTYVLPGIETGKGKLLGWVGDVVPFQTGVIFTATRTARDNPGKVERFLRAYRKGARDYHDAFTGPGNARQDQPTAPAVLAILSKYVGQTPERVADGVVYIQPEGRLDIADILHQIAWFKAQNMLKGSGDGADVIDRRFAVDLPAS